MNNSKPEMIQPEIILVPPGMDEVVCDGGNEAMGHPRVYYRFDGLDKVVCGYCDREFVKIKA